MNTKVEEMTAKEQGLPDKESVYGMVEDLRGCAKLCDCYSPDQAATVIDGIGWIAMRHKLNKAADMLTALASDTGERGVGFIVSNGKGNAWRMWDETGPEWTYDRDKALRFARREDAEAFARDDEDAWRIEPFAALRAQPAGGGDIPQWALPAVESALAMLDEQGYAHTDLAAFRDWLKESTP